MEQVRMDKYLWAIRLFKTRSQADAACDAGGVKCKGEKVKASKNVRLGEVYEVKNDGGKHVIQVTGILASRVAYKEAVNYYLDLTPEEEKNTERPVASSFYTGKRQSKQGRPTKQKRRDLDDFLNLE